MIEIQTSTATRALSDAQQHTQYLRYALSNLIQARSFSDSRDMEEVTGSVVDLLSEALASERVAEHRLQAARENESADRERANLDALRDKLNLKTMPTAAEDDDLDLPEYGA